MAQLIIGHTTETTARIWVRGDRACTCEVAVRAAGDPTVQRIPLGDETDDTGIVDFENLTADTQYAVTATFRAFRKQEVHGRFRTLRRPIDGTPLSFSFVLSSCNLSVVSINNFLALLLASAGAATAMSSLDLPVERWRAPRFAWLWHLVRWPLKWLLGLVARVTEKVTGIKQPGPPYLRSPFLKLSAVFESWVVELAYVTSVPAVGDLVSVASAPDAEAATGVVACSPTVEEPARNRLENGEIPNKTCRLVLTQVEGTFKPRHLLFTQPQTASDTEKQPEKKRVGYITGIWSGKPWYTPPSFFIEAGDQIYYDFPVPERQPDRNEYRLAYREAWSYDVAKRYLLSHWPHYMTLDDHEIADQFARDFTPPAKDVSQDTYLNEASVAYREYTQAMNPPLENDVEGTRRRTGPYWYRFDKGFTRFFVLDTRTRRFNTSDPPQMIDDDQMCRLLQWMTCYKDDLKFVVTSVPFVAEINDAQSGLIPRWHQNLASQQPGADPVEAADPAETPGNPENDKWSAIQFKQQRSRIIEHIATNDIERLVFLTGDMHCCYHATMQITRSKTTRIGPEC
jgi:phosphodiesterase/alkaline phosphatase D-like protein